MMTPSLVHVPLLHSDLFQTVRALQKPMNGRDMREVKLPVVVVSQFFGPEASAAAPDTAETKSPSTAPPPVPARPSAGSVTAVATAAATVVGPVGDAVAVPANAEVKVAEPNTAVVADDQPDDSDEKVDDRDVPDPSVAPAAAAPAVDTASLPPGITAQQIANPLEYACIYGTHVWTAD